MTDTFLDKAYSARDLDETRALYNAWSASYEAELGANGYATPGRCAKALAEFMPDKSKPILDFGCGTGLGGLALKLAGFELIDGQDLSPDMLAEARKKKIYRNLVQAEEGMPLPHEPGDYAAISAIGVIGVGAGPAALFDQLMQGLGSGGKFVFSFNDHTLEDPMFEARIMEWTDCGAAVLLHREHGEHLPGIDMKSTVYVIEKK
ncbi:MAG: class I SAM-dependent DNA methyltransferase [Sulfitobacter sp.]